MPEAQASPRSARLLAIDLVPGDELFVDYPERTMRGHGWRVGSISPIGPTARLVALECGNRVELLLLSAYEEVDVWRRTCAGCGRLFSSPSAYWQWNVPECSYCFDGVARPA